jgi:SPX domain protein involved in polyphosphate accumulation
MGRYYNGDIEGKFWFAVQSSDDADFFGVTGYQPEELVYEFEEEELSEVIKGLETCKKKLKGYLRKIDNFFKANESYTEERLAEALKVDVLKAKELLQWYARYGLGLKIKNSIKENKQCYFTAEL